MKETIRKIEEMLELKNGVLSEETMLSEVKEWDSLAVISFIALADDFNKSVSGQDIKGCKTVGDLVKLII